MLKRTQKKKEVYHFLPQALTSIYEDTDDLTYIDDFRRLLFIASNDLFCQLDVQLLKKNLR